MEARDLRRAWLPGGRSGLVGVPVAAPQLWRRSAVAAATTTFLGLAGHVVAGGRVDPVGALLAMLPLLAVCRGAAHREAGLVRLLVLLTAGQVWVHLAASLTAASHAGHGADEGGAPMLLAHAAATVLAAAVLRGREAAAWSSARASGIAAVLAGALSRAVGWGPQRRRPTIPAARRSTVLRWVPLALPARRGPPGSATA